MKLKPVKNKRYYLHVSRNRDFGESVILRPRDVSADADWREPNDLRICVSSSLLGCLMAIPQYFGSKKYIPIYRTKNKVQGYYPHHIFDSEITEEIWLTEPAEFVKVGMVNVNSWNIVATKFSKYYSSDTKRLNLFKKRAEKIPYSFYARAT